MGADFNDVMNANPCLAMESLLAVVDRAEVRAETSRQIEKSPGTKPEDEQPPEFDFWDNAPEDELRQREGLSTTPPDLEIRDAVPTPNAAEIEATQRREALLGQRTIIDENTVVPPLELIGGLFPRGYLSFVAAQQGRGKSWLVQRIAVDLSAGGAVLDGIVHNEPPRRVLFFCGESRWAQFVRRSNQMRWNVARENLRLYDRWELQKQGLTLDLDTPEGQENVRAIVEGERPDVVFVDSLFDFHNADENKSDQMRPVMSFLNGIAEEFKLAVVLSHHNRKQRAAERKCEADQDDMQGSNVLHKSAAAIYMLRGAAVTDAYGTSLDDAVLVKCMKSWTRKPAPFAFRIEDEADGFHVSMKIVLNPDTGGTKQEQIAEIIEQRFEPGQWFSRKELLDFCDGHTSQHTADRALHELKSIGLIADNGKGTRGCKFMRVTPK